MNNLAGNPESAEIRKRMETELRKLVRELDDPGEAERPLNL